MSGGIFAEKIHIRLCFFLFWIAVQSWQWKLLWLKYPLQVLYNTLIKLASKQAMGASV
jgi:hypothetical protein